MRPLRLAGLFVTLVLSLGFSLGGTTSHAADCTPLGKVQFICGVVSPEDT